MSIRHVLAFGLALLAAPGAVVAQTDRSATFTLRITFDPAVSEGLIGMREWVTIDAFYFGLPAAKGVPVDDSGDVFLGSERTTIFPVNQSVVLGAALEGAPLDRVKEPRVNVNVFSAFFADEYNLIDCDFVDDRLAAVRGTEIAIHCIWLG